ncbi:MAG TPA: LuxR C-terminal-related transcriptional regulator [Anaerolineales bacterium]|nr:LuxR C-terminal-related transcriptional regulator [Anaerolineales bacterium]
MTGEVMRIMDDNDMMTEAPPAVRFTCKESKVFELLAAGKSNSQIAEVLCMSLRTVRFHVGNILKKLKAANRTEAG